MDPFITSLTSFSKNTIAILDVAIPMDKYVSLDLSMNNKELNELDITDPTICQTYIDRVLNEKKGLVAYGGYLEQRNLYADKKSFSTGTAPIRNIHLGMDFWCIAGTTVLAPLDGTVHSFKNNNEVGDYGPTIILKHALGSHIFYSLYGHLSSDSLDGLYVGKSFKKGQAIAQLGTPDINVNYAPHLHFQLIRDLEGNQGDYPGVCARERLTFYQANCPNPNLLLKL